jgi:transposase
MEQYIGIDLHKAFFQVCALRRDGAREWQARFPTTPAGVEGFLSRCTVPSAVAVEASGPTWTFADQIVASVARLHIVDAAKTRLRAGYAAKTDRLDAYRLADALRRQSVVSVYYPPVRVRELRELCRYRASLVRVHRSLKQRVQALLLRQGMTPPAVSDLFGRRGQAWLETVALAGRAGESLRGLRHLLTLTHGHLVEADAAVAEEAAADPIVGRLQQLPGIGPVLGLMVRAEIGTIDRFPDAAHVASYAGLVPRVDQSGARVHYGRITKAGSPWLRWALIEAAIHGVKRRDAVGTWARRLSHQKGALKARAAIARALCTEIFVAWHDRHDRLSSPRVGRTMTTCVVDA